MNPGKNDMRRKHFLAAQAWYGISQGAPTFLNPFINLFFHRLGLTPGQIGLLSALRPWISAPCGSILAGLADRWGCHRAMLVGSYLSQTLVQGLMALPLASSFGAMLALTVAASVVITPASIIVDAAVMAASTHPGDYGRLRTWASLSWTAFAPLAGWVNSTYGIRVGIVCFVVGSLLALPAAWMLPVEALKRKVPQIIERQPSAEEAEAAAEPLREPLLAEEAPTPASAPTRLSKALAIVRYVEAITELGVAPPAGAALYGYAALPLQYAAQHLAPAESPTQAAAFSPFAGGAEPGSEPSPREAGRLGLSLSNGESTHPEPLVEDGARAPVSPVAPPSPAASDPGAPGWAGHTSLQELRSAGAPRTATLPRPISADNLGRVASLRAGIPRIRTRQKLEPVEMSSEDEEGQRIVSPDTDEEPAPRAAPGRAASGVSDEAGEVFHAEDVPPPGQQPQLAGRQPLFGAPSASLLLRDIRGIRNPGQPSSTAAEATAATAGARSKSSSGELPVSYSPTGGAEAGGPALGEATTAYRSAAVHRLAQIFGGTGTRRTTVSAGGSGVSTPRGPGADRLDAAASLTPASASAANDGTGFTPVRRYLDYRRGKLERKRQQREDRVAAARAEGREPEPPTPLTPSVDAWLGSIPPSMLAAAQLPAHAVAQVDPREMREAVQLEAADALREHDPTASMIVAMLSKKLERMAAESKRERQRQRRAARLAAAAAAGSSAGPAAHEGASLSRLSGVPEDEGVAGVAKERADLELAAEAPLGVGAALKRLFSDPQVATFFFLTTLLGFGHGIVGSFLFMALAEQGASELLMGNVLVANALPELPAFFFFGSILAALGMNTVLLLAAGSLGARIWAYTLLPRLGLHWVVPIEALHAITFACGWSASAVNSSKIAPSGLESTTQAIFQGLWTGVGCGLAGLAGGILYASHGPQLLFKASGIAILVGTAAAALVTSALRWRRKRREVLPASASEEKLPLLAS